MILLEVFKKKGKVEKILHRTWQRISPELVYPPFAVVDPEQKLLFFGMVAYAAIFESALSAGMSPSAAHYLSRMLLGQYKLDASITGKVESVFSGTEVATEQENADLLKTGLAQIIVAVEGGEGRIEPILQEMATKFNRI